MLSVSELMTSLAGYDCSSSHCVSGKDYYKLTCMLADEWPCKGYGLQRSRLDTGVGRRRRRRNLSPYPLLELVGFAALSLRGRFSYPKLGQCKN